MASFKSNEEIMAELELITNRLLDLTEFEKKIDNQCKDFKVLIEALTSKISDEQTRINEFEKKISKQSEDIAKVSDSIDEQINQWGKQINDFFEKSSKQNLNSDALDKYIETMEKITKSFEQLLDEARTIQNQLMAEKRNNSNDPTV